ncbi:MAG TPA: LacI family DNA-binding transcriptional regulator [Streptosporangiaceae bacterium]|nr:LacI family DNA-binding transcriptional regulator [Streptosporangiaceae bacterium]
MPSGDREDRALPARAGAGPAGRGAATGERRPPRLKDVAEAAGVHVSTASRALNERTAALLSPQTLQRVRRAADGLGYRVNGMARALKLRRSLSVGMVVPDITNPFFPPAVRGAEDVLDRAGYSLLLASSDNDAGKARRQVAAMLEGQVDGLLLAMARREDPLVDELRAGGTPLVLVNRTIDRGGVPAVVPDDFHGTLQAVEHLHGLGHRRLAFICGPLSTSNGARRRASFEQALRRLGLPPGPAMETPAFDDAAGYAAGQALLAGHPEITAVVAGNDLLAVGIIAAAAGLGRRCPADISVVGFNDMLLAGRLQPPLTTVRVPQYDVGVRAADMLLALVAEPGRRPETVLISGELVVRGSTAPPPPAAAGTT